MSDSGIIKRFNIDGDMVVHVMTTSSIIYCLGRTGCPLMFVNYLTKLYSIQGLWIFDHNIQIKDRALLAALVMCNLCLNQFKLLPLQVLLMYPSDQISANI